MPQGTAPAGRCHEQRVGHFLIIDALEEPKESDSIPMRLVVQPVADGCNTTHDFIAPFGHEVLGFGVLEKWILGTREERLYIPTQRRDPERVPRVEPVRQVDEALEVSPITRRSDA